MYVVDGNPLDEADLGQLDRYWRAANYLSVGQIYLMDNPLLREPLQPEHVKPRLLGHWGTTPGLNLLYAHLNRIIRSRGPGGHLRHRSRARRSRAGRQRLAGGHLQRGLPVGEPRPGRHGAAVPPVLLPRRHPEPRRAGDARLDPRGRRARLLPVPRLRRRAGQPRPGRRLRDRRRRGRDRAAGHRLALQQVPRPGRRRRGAADPAPQRLQDRQPDGAGPHRRRRADRAADRVRLPPVPGRGRRPRPVHQRLAATLDECFDEIAEIQRRPAVDRLDRASTVADDRPADAEGLDRPEGGRRAAGRGHLARASGAAVGGPRRRGPPGGARGVDALLPAGGALRRRRCAAAPTSSTGCRRATCGWARTRTPTAAA